jgi:hypothetical protein
MRSTQFFVVVVGRRIKRRLCARSVRAQRVVFCRGGWQGKKTARCAEGAEESAALQLALPHSLGI